MGDCFRGAYCRAKADGKGFALFSNLDSRVKHLNRILALSGVLSSVNLMNGIIQLRAWLDHGGDFSLTLGLVCAAVSLLLGYGFLRALLERRRLKREMLLHE
mgnify:FL=1